MEYLYLMAVTGAITEELTKGFVAFLVLIAILFAMMIPVLAIPYIFIKMGSVAGKVQGKLNSMGRNARSGAMRSAKGAAKGAAGRAMERKAGQWASSPTRRADGKRDWRNRVGGYKNQRDFQRQQQSAIARRGQEDALAHRIQTEPAYQARSGGDHALAAAQAVVEKREREETENAVSQLRAAGIYHPERLVEVAQGRSQVTGTKGTVDASSSPAMQRAATAQLVSAQDAASLETLISSPTTDKQMVYEEIQKKYTDAKSAGAHLVKFDPGKAETLYKPKFETEVNAAGQTVVKVGANGQQVVKRDATGEIEYELDASGAKQVWKDAAGTPLVGWNEDRVQKEAARALSSLSAEKFASQDGPAAASAVKGYRKLVLEIAANPVPAIVAGVTPTQQQLDRQSLLKDLRTLQATARDVDSNAQMKARAKDGTRTAIDELLAEPPV